MADNRSRFKDGAARSVKKIDVAARPASACPGEPEYIKSDTI
jgi:hypothetical protein